MDKGKKILFKTFWNSNGYCYVDPTPEEFDSAVKEEKGEIWHGTK